MGYYARIYANADTAKGATVKVYSIDVGDFIAEVPYDASATDGTYVWIDSGPVEFVMELDEGYTFSQWVYRVGSETADVQYDTEDEYFYYTDEEYIVIRPEATASSGGTGEAQYVWIEFDTAEIYRIFIYYYDETGTEVQAKLYGSDGFYALPGTYMEVSSFRPELEGYSGYCELPDGTVQEIADADGNWINNLLYVANGGGTYRFYLDEAGGGTDYGSFVKRTPHFDGLTYTAYISDGSDWYEYKTLIAE